MLKTMVLCAGRHDVLKTTGQFSRRNRSTGCDGDRAGSIQPAIDLFPVTLPAHGLLNQADYTDMPVYIGASSGFTSPAYLWHWWRCLTLAGC